MTKRVVTFGEIMMRLKTPGLQRFSQADGFEASFGGGEANVAVSLAQFGYDPLFVTALPVNDLATSAVATLRGLGVQVAGPRKKSARLGLYFMETGANQRSGRVIYDREGSAFSLMEKGEVNWPEMFRGADWFHISGISPAVSQQAADVSLEAMHAARKAGLTVSLDLNYRAKLWNYTDDHVSIMRQLVACCDVLIAGREDCQQSLGIEAEGDQESVQFFHSLTQKVQREFDNVRIMAITIRDTQTAEHHQWASCVRADGETLFSRQYEIRDIVDRVGSGDAFSAGLIYGLSEQMALEDALEFASAANCLKHSIEGDFNLVSVAEVQALMNNDAVGRVQR